MELDEILSSIGAYGRYQVLVYLVICFFNNFLSIWHMSVMAFIGYEPVHYCKLPFGAQLNLSISGKYEDGEYVLDKCDMRGYDNYTNTYSNTTGSCDNGWYYKPDPVTSSVVTEWDLVCDRNVLPETSQMVFNFGVMFGGILLGFTSDRYGRKKTLIFSCFLQAILGTATAFAPSFYVFMALRFFVGALEQGVNITGFIMATELFPPRERTVMALTHEFFWAIGGAILPIMAYFLRDWRHLQMAVSIPGIFLIFFWWVTPESLVWLISKGKLKEAEAILQKAAKFNGKFLPPNSLTDGETKPMISEIRDPAQRQEKTKTYTFIDLFRTPNMRRISVCLCTLWAVNTMVYYGISYNTPNLYGDMYLNFFIAQMVEVPSVLLTLILIYKVGRRWPLCLFHVFGGIVCIASPFVPAQSGGYDLKWVSVTLAMIGKFAINSSFTIIYIYGPEIYPTVVRNTGSGLASTCGRFGGVLYPYVIYLSKLNIGPINKKLPLLVFGILGILGGLLALPLPETRHNPLPESIEDVENYEEFCRKHKQKENGVASPVSDSKDTTTRV